MKTDIDRNPEGLSLVEMESYAKAYVNKRISNRTDFNDAVQEYILGCLEAEKKAIPGKGLRTYQKTCGEGRVMTFINRGVMMKGYEKVVSRKHNDEGVLEVTERHIGHVDMNTPVQGVDECTLSDVIEDKKAVEPIDLTILHEDVKALHDALLTLRPNYYIAIRMRYFLDASLEEIADELQVSKQRVHQIIETGLSKLKKELGKA